MSDQPMGPGWWQASDGRYYPPETRTDAPGAPAGPSDAGPWSPDLAGGYQHGPYAYGAVPPKQGTNGMAIASLVCSLLGLCCWVTCIAGIVLGHLALRDLNRPDNHETGRGMAIAGLVVGYVLVAIGVLYILALVVSGV